jgi:hypothetical protein
MMPSEDPFVPRAALRFGQGYGKIDGKNNTLRGYEKEGMT